MKTKYEAGSFQYGQGFIPSVGRYTPQDAGWHVELIVVNNRSSYPSPQEAAMHAKLDIDKAYAQALAQGGGVTIDHLLAQKGYEQIIIEDLGRV